MLAENEKGQTLDHTCVVFDIETTGFSPDKNKIIEEEDEEKAYEKIAEEFGIDPVRLMWGPNGMEFIKMELDTDIQVAELDYQYNKKRRIRNQKKR